MSMPPVVSVSFVLLETEQPHTVFFAVCGCFYCVMAVFGAAQVVLEERVCNTGRGKRSTVIPWRWVQEPIVTVVVTAAK